mmetsp:Transcript_120425/g.374984  ORF Transcript_120425/g.374984 Transcript_120425/m.374984 type:complete len:156 (-) Transcript_120425:359-826(-)
MDAPVWTCRQRMAFPRVDPTVHYCVPLFLHQADSEVFWLTDGEDRPLACSKDPVFEAVDHHLFWLDHPPAHTVLFHCQPEAPLASRRAPGRTPEELEALWRPDVRGPEAVLPLADFFGGGPEARLCASPRRERDGGGVSGGTGDLPMARRGPRRP